MCLYVCTPEEPYIYKFGDNKQNKDITKNCGFFYFFPSNGGGGVQFGWEIP